MFREARPNSTVYTAFLTAALASAPLSSARAEGGQALVGAVRDAATQRPLPGVTVAVTSAALQGSLSAVTDETGRYRIAQLPPGVYALKLEKDGYRAYSSTEVGLRTGSTLEVNASLLPLTIAAPEITVTAPPPSVDIASPATVVTVSGDFTRLVPVWEPSAKGGPVRSIEALADIAPGVHADAFGLSIAGTSSPENQYLIDGLSVRDPQRGLLGTPLSAEFIKEVNVTTGGLMPEYGRVTGGVLDAVTKSGSNELHGSVFSSITPGALEGPRQSVKQEGQTIQTFTTLSSSRDFGFDLGGPIRRDKLWFYGGAQLSLARYQLVRSLNERLVTGGALARDPTTNLTLTKPLPGTERTFYADQQSIHYIGKLTYQIAENHRAELSFFGVRAAAGGHGTFAIRPQTGAVELSNIAGTYGALASDVRAASNNVVLSLASAFQDKHLLVDATFGWHRDAISTLPSDGSLIGSHGGLADVAHVIFRRTKPWPHTIGDFSATDPIPAGACKPVPGVDEKGNPTVIDPCPVSRYEIGGIQELDVSTLDRFVGKVIVTRLVNALGHHVIKAGVDIERMTFQHHLGYGGGVRFSESTSGTSFTGTRYGFLVAPDEPVIQDVRRSWSASIGYAGFLQDSWNVMDRVVLNLGMRYDGQTLLDERGSVGLTLPSQWAPRVGVVYDITRSGRSKLFASFARYYESIPLSLADGSFQGEQLISANYDAKTCNPTTAAGQKALGCVSQGFVRRPGTSNPNEHWAELNSDAIQVDPALRPSSTDEIMLGGEYEVAPDGRVGVTYTKRYLNDIIEDISRDEGNSFFIGNPGAGIASDLPKATRDYDALTLYFSKSSSRGWLAQASYTLSWLRGSYEGLFHAENTQFEPHRNSDYDLLSLLPNHTGDLPADHRHQIKLFAAKDFSMRSWLGLQGGLGFRAASGAPSSYLGYNSIYGSREVFILPRGIGERLLWVSSLDTHLGVSLKLARSSAVLVSIDIFNILNLQDATAVDESYTFSPIYPVVGASKGANDLPKNIKNPNFGKPTAYQPPRTFRFAARVTF